jgi:hypothetical protein
MIDFDHQPEPPLTDLITRPVDAALYLVGRLPPEFQDATFYWQWGSSQGLPSDLGFLSLHAWFWCARAYSDEELTRWANFVNRNGQIIDPAVFRTVQANYIAQPLFLGGLIDPLPQRQGIWLGLDHEIEIIIPPSDPKNPERIAATGYEPGLGIAAYLARIGGAEGFRHPILQTIGSFVAIHGGKADPQPLYHDIRKAVANADHGARSPEQIARYVSDQHLDEMLAWIRLQHGDQPPKPPPRLLPEPPTDWPEPPVELPPGGDLVPPYSDEDLALRFALQHSENLRFTAAWDHWHRYDNGVWRHDETLNFFDNARAICRTTAAEINDPDDAKKVASASTVAATVAAGAGRPPPRGHCWPVGH